MANAEKARFVEAYEAGVLLRDIGAMFGFTASWASERARRWHLPPRAPGRRPVMGGPHMMRIMAVTADECDLPFSIMQSHSRMVYYVRARHAAMYVAHVKYGYSYTMIGRVMGKRDHTTILHGVRRVEGEWDYDTEMRALVKRVMERLDGGDTGCKTE